MTSADTNTPKLYDICDNVAYYYISIDKEAHDDIRYDYENWKSFLRDVPSNSNRLDDVRIVDFSWLNHKNDLLRSNMNYDDCYESDDNDDNDDNDNDKLPDNLYLLCQSRWSDRPTFERVRIKVFRKEEPIIRKYLKKHKYQSSMYEI